MIDFLRVSIALLPLGLYFIVIGGLRTARRPVMLNGSVDFLLLGIGVSGLIIIGPIELFFPRAAYSVLGIWTWVLLMVLYMFVLFLVALSLPPKLIVYGVGSGELIVLLREMLAAEEWEAEWMGSVVCIETLGIRGSVERANSTDTVSQISIVGKDQNLIGWHRLERSLTHYLYVKLELKNHRSWVWSIIGANVLILAWVLAVLDHQRLVAGFVSFWE